MTGWGSDNGALGEPAQTVQQGTFPSRVSLTLKGDGAFDSPWYVIHGQDAADVLEQLKDPALTELLQAATNVSTHWAKHLLSVKGLEPVSPQRAGNAASTPTPAAQAAPADSGPAPMCEHGPRQWKDFTSKAGNHVKGWFCTTRNSDCKPLYSK